MALRDLSQRLRVTLERAPAGVAFTDPSDTLIKRNLSVHRTVGYPESELAGKNVREITHAEDLHLTARALDACSTRRRAPSPRNAVHVGLPRGPPGQPVVWFQYAQTRSSEVNREFLFADGVAPGSGGDPPPRLYLLSDGYSADSHLAREASIVGHDAC
jgi:PAS domain S-box-containing protein